ncbi:hypothetical protein EGJ86_19260 [Pseudomonas sp. o96-267]|uniref:hypothetical protein n=1 Tax=Pseudomonas sp. o96-267 TaxID=2479853 RepID=UPI000F76AE7D|nr:MULTISPECIES: hypothetical protein [Pseudomonas]MDH0959093.1 hypothetical protein [Pseudomonas chengduensis]MDV5863599.1 hypothetical protein [Pseudomonas mendocina]RRV31712.1 hypothetical protein EGJ86_19260 [Pseudomonas sp. o96-267]
MQLKNAIQLTKEQRAARREAAITALREHFTGHGAGARSGKFLRRAAMSSLGWFTKLMLLAPFAVMAVALAGGSPLKQLHAWMVQ